MQKDGDNEDKFICTSGEKVTFTFQENDTTFEVQRDFEEPAPPPDPDPDILNAGRTMTFPVEVKVRVHLDYDFNTSGSFYNVTIKGESGRTFKRKINSTFKGIHPTRRTYEFRVVGKAKPA